MDRVTLDDISDFVLYPTLGEHPTIGIMTSITLGILSAGLLHSGLAFREAWMGKNIKVNEPDQVLSNKPTDQFNKIIKK